MCMAASYPSLFELFDHEAGRGVKTPIGPKISLLLFTLVQAIQLFYATFYVVINHNCLATYIIRTVTSDYWYSTTLTSV